MNARRYIVLLSKMSVKKLLTITLLIKFILLTGVTEEESIDLYNTYETSLNTIT